MQRMWASPQKSQKELQILFGSLFFTARILNSKNFSNSIELLRRQKHNILDFLLSDV
jgi:hypothetical protein